MPLRILRTIYGVAILLPLALALGMCAGVMLWWKEYIKEIWN